jgi:hypothetical protein
MKIKLDAPTRAKMREQYRDCLCQNCLEGFANDVAGSGKATLE